jgi:succinate dehydrogenase hydrophobic anchor subunit
MPSRATRLVLAALVAGLLAFVVAAPASSYGKATWQTALNGTFNFPGAGTALGF